MKTQICDRCSRSIEDGALYEDHSQGASFVTPTAAKRKRLGINAPWENANPTRPPTGAFTVEDLRHALYGEREKTSQAIRKLVAQRDELLAAAKAWEYARKEGGISMVDWFNVAWEKTQSAIAKCEAQP